MRKKLLIPALTLMTLGALAQSEIMNHRVKSEVTFKVAAAEQKRYQYFPENAPVTMADGSIKEMAEIRVGEYVRTFRKGRSIITRVNQIDVYNYPSSSLTAIYLRPSSETTASALSRVQALLLEATPYHYIQTGKGKKRVKNLSKKDLLYHFEPATGELSTWKVGAIQENARKVNKAYNIKTDEGTYLVENVVVN